MEQASTSTVAEVLATYGVDLDMGLSAEQVGSAERLYGFNELASNPGPPMWRLVLKQFDDLMVKILLTAAALDLLIAWGNGEGLGSLVEPGVILLILAANATVGVVTETNAAQAIEALKALEAEHALVLRGGAWRTLPARQVVPGDVVEVSPGSKVPADVRVVRLDGPQLRVDQSILTGESGSVRKDAEALRRAQAVVQDRTNILFGGTVVTAGRAACVVVATGSRSAMGAIRDAVAAQAEGETPLQKRLDELGVVLAKIITVICVAVWLLSLPHFSDPAHGSWLAGGLYYFKVAVALAVAAIPEGLPAVVTTCLALGTRAMAQRGAIVRRLPSVETLGCTTVICCDKTGTLTSNQMAVSHVVVLESAGGGILGEVPTDPPADPPRDVSHSVWSWRGSFSRGASAGEGAADASPDEPVAGVRAASAPPLPLAPLSLAVTGSSYDPQGWIYRARGAPGARLQPERVERPAQAMRTLRMLGLVSAQCNDARLEMGPQGKLERTGEATEVALRVFCEKLGLPQGLAVAEQSSVGAGTPANAGWAEACPRVGGLEFSRERRCMSSLVEVLGGASGLRGRLLLCKGSPESILERCRFCAFEQGSDQAPPGPNSTLPSELADFLPSVCPLDPAQRALLLSQATSLGARGALRMLGVAFRVWKESPRELEPEDENDLVFVGLLGIHDPPRPDVAAALRLCARAGIRVIMVTGDNAATAQAVGAQVGLLPAATQAAAKSSPLQNDAFERATPPLSPPLSHMPSPFVHLALQEAQSGLEGEGGKSRAAPGLPLFSSVHPLPSFLEEASSILSSESLPAPSSSRPVRALTGLDFDSLDDHGQARAARRMAVFSRVEARHKSRLVELLRAQGEVVAMTGDGVNDAPALRAADIGVAMGSGTAVAREAADMVLADDRFSTIVAAVGAGRTIFANTQQFVRYMISSNIGEVVAILTCTLLGLPECLAPVQLLWVNLVTDGLPATALGFNPPDPLVMSRPPRRASQAVVGPRALMRYALVGAYVGAVTVAGFVHAFTAAPDGPGLRFSQLRNFEHCVRDSDAGARPASIPCDVFETRLPSTVAMTVLVVVEMFNALNALSEEASLLQLPPWANPWLLAAIALTLALHCCVLYLPPLAAVFGTAALSWADWQAVLALSAPVLLLDEALKLWARAQAAGGVEDRVDAALRGARLATRGRWARARRAALRWWEGRRGKISAASAMALRADAV